MQPTIKELVVYTPARDFAVSKRFYAALGFKLTEGWGDTMDCELGGAKFRLQNYFVKQWAENFMMKFDVEDVDSWFAHVKAILEAETFGDARVAEPEMVGETKIIHVWDPCGVLLIFIE